MNKRSQNSQLRSIIMEGEASNFISQRNAVRCQNQFVSSLEAGKRQQTRKQTQASNRSALQAFSVSFFLYRTIPNSTSFLEKAEQTSFKFDARLFKFTLGLPRELSWTSLPVWLTAEVRAEKLRSSMENWRSYEMSSWSKKLQVKHVANTLSWEGKN